MAFSSVKKKIKKSYQSVTFSMICYFWGDFVEKSSLRDQEVALFDASVCETQSPLATPQKTI